jgi:hypothetical protein
MGIESGPKPIESSEPELEKKESKVLDFDVFEDIIASQIGNKAKVKRLEVEEEDGGAKFSAKIDAGMLGGKISIEGHIINDSDGIAIGSLDIEAREYVKSPIENSLSGFGTAIEEYFEKKYGKSVSRINISGSNLIVDLENVPDVDASSESESEGLMEELREIVNGINPWKTMFSLEVRCLEDVELGEYSRARELAELISSKKNRDIFIANINKIEELER